MFLQEEKINDLVSDIRNNKLNMETLNIKYNPRQGYTVLSGTGAPGIMQEEDYYETVEENLIATELSWLNLFCRECEQLGIMFEARVPVLPDGNFDQSRINTVLNIHVPNKVHNLPFFLDMRLNKLMIFHSFINGIELKGHRGQIGNILIELELDGKLVTKYLNEKRTVNKLLIEQWTNTIDNYNQNNAGKKYFNGSFKVKNGKIDTHAKKITLSAYVNHLEKVQK